jgi:hypothetical protein
MDLACSAIACAKSFWEVAWVTTAAAATISLVRVLAAVDAAIATLAINVVAVASVVAIIIKRGKLLVNFKSKKEVIHVNLSICYLLGT